MKQGDTYYSGEQWGQCKICGSITDVREGGCFTCADAQSIIGTGVDMYDRTVDDYVKWEHKNGDGPELPVEFVNKRIRLLVKSGWNPPKSEEEQLKSHNTARDAIALESIRTVLSRHISMDMCNKIMDDMGSVAQQHP